MRSHNEIITCHNHKHQLAYLDQSIASISYMHLDMLVNCSTKGSVEAWKIAGNNN